ncbi:MAG: ATP-binding protein [Gemmatimonadaceae bacterium]|nr:ATP-binding protein [Gemmatimonadaceae bacterium]
MTRNSRYPRGIQDKLVLAFSTLVAAIAIFVFVFFPERLERQTLRATAAKADAISQMTAYSVATGLLFGDRAAVSEVLVGAAVEDVAFLIVWDDTGQLVAMHGATTRSSAPPPVQAVGAISADGRNYVTTTAVMSGQRRVGTLSVGLSLASLHAEVASSRQIGAVVGFLIFTVGLVLIFAISTFVTRPLKAVGVTVDRIAAGDLSLRATETADVEVAQLVRAFNRMIDQLVGAQAELAAVNADLESRVDERTAALRAAVEEQRQSRAALALSEADARRTSALLEALIDVAPLAIVTTDARTLVTRWNHAAERMFGWTSPEVLGRPLPYLPPSEAAELPAPALPHASTAGAAPREVTRVRKDGTSVSALLGVGELHDERRAATGCIHVLTDLTEYKRLEEQLLQSQKMDAMGRLAGGIAHDFNNMLTVITSGTELMLLDPRSEEDFLLLGEVAGAATRAAALTRQLLTFTRQQVVQPRIVELSTVVRGLETILRRVLRSNIAFSTRVDASVGSILADPTQLEQVVMNLVVNAADAMPQGGSLRIETRHCDADEWNTNGDTMPAGRLSVLVVEDTGTGIDDATRARMFEPFFTTKGIGQGTGLGLSTTYGIVTGLGGSIRVHSAPGQGATFTIAFPETQRVAPIVAASVPSRAPMPRTRSQGYVLVVEDESIVRDVMRRSLEVAGFEVLEADGGAQALEILSRNGHQIHAVVTDVMMPGMTGRVLADIIRARWPSVGVVFVSGYTETILEDDAVLDERHVFLQKPFTAAELTAAIAAVAQR